MRSLAGTAPTLASFPGSGRILATANGMQYLLRTPSGYPRAGGHPTVIPFPGGSKDWQATSDLYAAEIDAQGYPFISAVPLGLMNGGTATGGAPWSGMAEYTAHYPAAIIAGWTSDAVGMSWELDGIQQMMDDITRLFRGNGKFFLNGYSGGGNDMHGCLFNFPERIAGAHGSSPNYGGKMVDTPAPVSPYAPISTNAARLTVPVQYDHGALDPNWTGGANISAQVTAVMALEAAHQYNAVNPTIGSIGGLAHDPLVATALAYFTSLPGGQ